MLRIKFGAQAVSVRRTMLSSRLARPTTALAACLAVGALAVACGGGDEEAEVREAIDLFLADDPRKCEVMTDRLLRNSENEADLLAARRRCREEDSEQAFIRPPAAGETSDVVVDGDRADARVTLQGGELDGQDGVFELRRVNGAWKVDVIDGLEVDDRLRRRFEQGLRDASGGGTVGTTARASQLECMLERLRESLPNERIAERMEGRLAPGTFDRALDDALAACVESSPRGVRAGTGYRVTPPTGWLDLTDFIGPALQSGLDRGAFAKPSVDLVLAEGRTLSNGGAFVVRESGLPADLTLAKYLEAAGVSGRPDPMTLDGVDAITYELPSGEGERQRHVVVLRDRVAYVVAFTADDRRFDDGVERFEAMLASWRWE